MNPSEFELIEQAFRRHSPPAHPMTRVANGDDASVHEIPPDMELVISTDTSVAGIHWPDDFPLDQAADRAVCAALSDLAAMGAEACWLWLSVLAKAAADAEIMGKGVNAALNRYSVELAGGDTVAAPVNALCLTVGGVLPKGAAMRRDSAKFGDDLWLCGMTGRSALGLRQWQEGQHDGRFVLDFCRVEPLLKEGIRLRELGVKCCIDVSDGLLQDAGHVARASGVGMSVNLESLPGWQEVISEVSYEQALSSVLAGGEDYALLFTVPVDLRSKLETLAERIGSCSQGSCVEVLHDGQAIQAPMKGFDHFG